MEKIFQKVNYYFVGKWHFAVLDIDKGRWIKSANLSNIPYLKSQNAGGRHILIQPLPKVFGYYFFADDLNWEDIIEHHKSSGDTWKPGRMVVETSPDNFQVWIHSSRYLTVEEKRYWLAKMNSDPGADPNNRWGRCPGFRNRKEKYRDDKGDYPLSKLIWVDWKHQVDIPDVFSRISGGNLKNNAPVCRSAYDKGNESQTDMSYALALIYRGYGDAEIENLLRSERTQWNNHLGANRQKAYLERTIRKARYFFEQNKNK